MDVLKRLFEQHYRLPAEDVQPVMLLEKSF
jgi:hypothetical protein